MPADYKSLALKSCIADPKPIYIPTISPKSPIRTLTPSIATILVNLPKEALDIALFASIKASSDNSILINTKFIRSYRDAVIILLDRQGNSKNVVQHIGYQSVKKHIISLINSFILIKLPTPKPLYLINPSLSHLKRPHGLSSAAYRFSCQYTELQASGKMTLEDAQRIANEYYIEVNRLLDKFFRNDERRAKVNISVAKSRANKKKNKPQKED